MSARQSATSRRDDRRTRSTTEPALQNRVVTVDQAKELCPNEWILMQVLERDEYDSPSRGIIQAHRTTRGGVPKTLLRIVAKLKDDNGDYCLFYSFRDLRTPEEWREALERALRQNSKDPMEKAWLEDAKEALIAE